MRTASMAFALAALLLGSATGVDAQNTQGRMAPPDGPFRRAIALVNDGEGAAGRALLDSLVEAARPNSLDRAEALFWRATVAPTAADAEQDYKRVILEHPSSPRVADALLRLAQLELARGDRENAVRRLQRLEIEYPAYPARARTSYWLARAHLDQNDLERGCAAVVEARSRTPQNDVELRNQIDFLALRCPPPGVAAATAAPRPPQAESTAAPRADSGASPPSAAVDTQATRDTGTPAPARTPSPAPATPSASAPPPAAAASGSGAWSVQVAAFGNRAQAAGLAERLRGRGFEARVDGTVAPFRVRIGRYQTRAAAAAALEELKGRGMNGFVTDARTR